MSNAIQFLEQMGQSASLRYAQHDELECALVSAQVEPGIRAAIFNVRQRELEVLLGATANVCCGMHPATDQ